jgi:hypothetical protein
MRRILASVQAFRGVGVATRKYISEFGLNMQAVRVILLQQRHLELLTEDNFGPGRQCHIYAIGRRPRITFDPTAFKIRPESVSGAFVVNRREGPQIYDFEVGNGPEDSVVRVECEYPYSDFSFRDANGKSVIDGPVAQYLAMVGLPQVYPEAFDLEVLYVGQAYGKDGKRTAPQRLGHHETLQKIYAEAIHRSPEMDIWIVLFSFDEWILASFDSRTDTFGTTPEEDLEHMEKVLHTEVTEGQRINYTEAAMIRYFQPQYNIEFKDSFPDQKHTSYAECYALDLNAVCVELDTGVMGCCCRLWSPAVEPDWVHLISYQLHSLEERQHMFDLSPNAFSRDAGKQQKEAGEAE